VETSGARSAGEPARAEAPTEPGELAGRVSAMLPDQLLQPGEIIILLLKPSPWFIVLESLRTLTLVALAVAGALLLQQGGYIYIGRSDIVLCGVFLAGVRLFWQFLEWLSRVYVLTDRRVIRVKGVLRVHVFEAALKQIQHTQALFSVRERLFRLGTISFATAGTGAAEAFWQMVAQPLEVHQTVVRAINRYR
jgi:uncharacterized membrane protein YdbT with pleckstrin-like domain